MALQPLFISGWEQLSAYTKCLVAHLLKLIVRMIGMNSLLI